MSTTIEIQPLVDTLAARVRACDDALLALRAGHGAIEDVRAKLQQRMSDLREEEVENRGGLREALAIVGNLSQAVVQQLPMCEGQATEARLTYSSVAAHVTRSREDSAA